MSHIKYTKELLSPIVAESVSVAQVLTKLGLKQAGGTQSHISKKIKLYGLDTSHFKGQGWNKGKKFPSKYPTEEYLSNQRPIQSDKLKKRLIKEAVLEARCSKCRATEWLDLPISLELHHIDCDHSNNNLSNLQILCPNCHAYEHTVLRTKLSKSEW